MVARDKTSTILGIVCGPRKGKATDRLVDMIIKGAEEKGAQGEKLYLFDLDIKPCRACAVCEKTKKCVIEDDHQKVLDKMDQADIVVFSSPTYFSNVSSVAKAFIDRSARFFSMTKLGPRRFAAKPNKVILVTACGAPYPFSHLCGFATGCIQGMEAYFKKMKVRRYRLVATGIVDFNEAKCKRVLNKAYQLGRKVVCRG